MTTVSSGRKPATWHAIVHTFDVLIVTIMDTSQWIALTKYHPQACQHDAEITPLADLTDQHLRPATPGVPTMTIETGMYSVTLNPTHTTPDIGVTVIVIPAEAILDHFINPSCHSSSHHRSSSTYHYCHDTPYHRSSSCRHFSQDDSRSRTHKSKIQNTGNIINLHKDHLPVHTQHPGSLRMEGTNRFAIDDPPSEYYSSNEQDSDSEDDLN